MYSTSMTNHRLNFSISYPVSHEITMTQARQFCDEDLIRDVSAFWYQVMHSFYKIFWIIGDPTEALHGFQWNKQKINHLL